MQILVKRLFLFIVLIILFLSGCRSSKELVTFEDILYPEGRFFTIRHSDDYTKQRFNFYFLEANRLKALGDAGNSALLYMEAIRIDSTCATCYFEISHLLIRNREFEDAEKFAFKSVQYEPNNEFFVNLLSQIYFHNSKHDKALLTSKYLVELNPDNPEYLYQVSQILFEKGRYKESIDYLNRIESIVGINEALTFEKHSLYLEAGKSRKALNEIQKLIDTHPENADYLVYLGDYYTQQRKYKKAESAYNDVQLKFPENGLVNFSLANLYLIKNDTVSFKRHLFNGFSSDDLSIDNKVQRILPFLMNLEDPNNPFNSDDFDNYLSIIIDKHPYESIAYVLYGNYLTETNQDYLAIDVYETALLIDEKQEEIWHDFLLMVFNDTNRTDRSKYALRATELYPENPFFNYLAGFSFLIDDKKELSIKFLELAKEHGGSNVMLKAQVLGLLGDLYVQIGEIEKGFSAYDESLTLNSDNIVVLNNFAYYLSLERRDLDRAETMISRVIQQEPENSTYLDTYAWVLFKQGRYLDALYYIERAVKEDDSENGVILEHYGDILYKNGMVEEALFYWKKAIVTEDDVSKNLDEKIQIQSYIE